MVFFNFSCGGRGRIAQGSTLPQQQAQAVHWQNTSTGGCSTVTASTTGAVFKRKRSTGAGSRRHLLRLRKLLRCLRPAQLSQTSQPQVFLLTVNEATSFLDFLHCPGADTLQSQNRIRVFSSSARQLLPRFHSRLLEGLTATCSGECLSRIDMLKAASGTPILASRSRASSNHSIRLATVSGAAAPPGLQTAPWHHTLQASADALPISSGRRLQSAPPYWSQPQPQW